MGQINRYVPEPDRTEQTRVPAEDTAHPVPAILRLQRLAGNHAVTRLIQRQPTQVVDEPSAHPTSASFPWVGKIDVPYNAALRGEPTKDPNAPYANILADLQAGTMVEVTGIDKGWLRVEVIDPAGGTPRHGYVSHELVRFVRAGAWEIEMPPMPVERIDLTVSEAFVVLKRAETKRLNDPKYAPTDDEARRIEVATKTLEDTTRYRVDRGTYVVTFVHNAGTKIKIESIEDFVLFVETVERQYPTASAKEVASEIRQVWFAGDKWETLLASRGIAGVDIEDPAANPIGQMFDMADLHDQGKQKVFPTRLGDVAISHVLAGIDATMSGMAAEPSGWHPKLQKGWELANDVMHGDPRDFATWSGDIGQAYGEYIVARYHNDVTDKSLKDYIADKASPAQMLGDIHGYIAKEVWRDTPTSVDPAGANVTVSGILRDLYMVDRTGTASDKTYLAYLEKLTGNSGADLRAMIVDRSLGFARLWYVKALATMRTGHYADQFDTHHQENNTSAAPDDKLDGVIDSFMTTLAAKTTTK